MSLSYLEKCQNTISIIYVQCKLYVNLFDQYSVRIYETCLLHNTYGVSTSCSKYIFKTKYVWLRLVKFQGFFNF